MLIQYPVWEDIVETDGLALPDVDAGRMEEDLQGLVVAHGWIRESKKPVVSATEW
jgi:hypothetical protein